MPAMGIKLVHDPHIVQRREPVCHSAYNGGAVGGTARPVVLRFPAIAEDRRAPSVQGCLHLTQRRAGMLSRAGAWMATGKSTSPGLEAPHGRLNFAMSADIAPSSALGLSLSGAA